MKLLLKIRLSFYCFILFVVFFLASYVVPTTSINLTDFALVSVNSLLYGFYIMPILIAQKHRIEELTKTIRAEANAIFDILMQTRKLPQKSRHLLQDMCGDYLQASFHQRRPAEGEYEYERIISYCMDYSGKEPEVIDSILEKLAANQMNRSQLAMHLNNRVLAHEWLIMLLLFGITIGFLLSLNADGLIVEHVFKAALCTGVSLLMISVFKQNNLSHKRAREIWQPLDTLKTSRFRRFD